VNSYLSNVENTIVRGLPNTLWEHIEIALLIKKTKQKTRHIKANTENTTQTQKITINFIPEYKI
jgi:hypothetical protein